MRNYPYSLTPAEETELKRIIQQTGISLQSLWNEIEISPTGGGGCSPKGSTTCTSKAADVFEYYFSIWEELTDEQKDLVHNLMSEKIFEGF